MRTKIIKIGNSRGIMLSRHLLNQYALQNEVEIVPKKEGILIKPAVAAPRSDWEEKFKEALKKGDIPDKELLEGFSNDFDENEWKW